MYYYRKEDELYHHGIKGQKWGVRKYQNKDGSLTPLGRQKYHDASIRIYNKQMYPDEVRAAKKQSAVRVAQAAATAAVVSGLLGAKVANHTGNWSAVPTSMIASAVSTAAFNAAVKGVRHYRDTKVEKLLIDYTKNYPDKWLEEPV